MADRPPFYFNGSTTAFSLRRMTDAQLATLRYNIRLAYASVATGNGNGRVYTGGTNNIGQALSTEYTHAENTNARDNNPNTSSGHPGVGPGEDYPDYPSLGTTTRSTSTFTQTRTDPGMPSNADLRDKGFLYWAGSTTSFNLRVLSAEQDFVDTLIADTITEACTGDEVGTYRVATSSPGSGWVDKGVAFTNTYYSNAGATAYNLWLRTSASDPGGGQNPVGWKSGGAPFMARSTASNSTLVTDVLLPILQRRVANNGAMNYNINGSTTGGGARGSMIDTRLNSSTTSQWFTNPTYYRSRTPSGSAATNSTYVLNITS